MSRDVLDEIDEAVAQVSDADVEASLREVLRRAGFTELLDLSQP